MPQYTGLRRSSMDSRSMRLSQLSRSYQTPSPSPLTPYNAVIRASLPDSHLYAVSQRPVASPIPGPLPSPGFSFGAASSNTPSMASPSSGDSERNSPDSLRSFTFRGDETEQDDDATSPSYTAYSRFGSIASIATSESSVNSSYYAEIGGAAVEHAHLEDRRDSCASGNFLGMLSGLDVGNQVEHMGHAGSMGLGIGAAVGYPPTHEEYTFSASAGEGLELVSGSVTDGHLHQQQSADQQQQEQYPSPASTIAPNSNGQSPQPRAQDPPSANVPISTSSELAFALEGKPGQSSGTASPPETYVNYGEHSPPEQLQHETSYFPQQLEHQPQDANASFSQTYSFPNGSQQQQPQLDYGVFSSSGSFVDPLATGGVMDNGLQSVEAFVAYTFLSSPGFFGVVLSSISPIAFSVFCLRERYNTIHLIDPPSVSASADPLVPPTIFLA
ncbi:hypothetical protein NLJ89_g2170 [Agrocybe chaxingu]|uniref:Uncharacterized protein n=1 Tax=Agrocybe chaxingu TaxID=84603 RepID=A0A9W8MWR4_9AGAR|nr:hypothetical protein NLJ89_g2170 [Agrocybe chaxingu]